MRWYLPIMNKTDMQLKRDVEEELRWDPRVNSAQIGVTVEKGAVSLLGTVDTYPEKWAVEDATKRVSGVRTVAHDLTVKVLDAHKRSDSEIAVAVQSVLTWSVSVPRGVTASVAGGVVTLEGQVGGNHQRDAAERAVRYLAGVVSVHNSIRLERQPSPAQVKEKEQAIEDAANAAWAAPGVTAVIDQMKMSMTVNETVAQDGGQDGHQG